MSPRANLLTGIALIALALMETLSGQAIGRFGTTAERDDNPKKFWGLVAVGYVAGVFFLGRYLYELL